MQKRITSSPLFSAIAELAATALQSQFELAQQTPTALESVGQNYRVYECTTQNGLAAVLVRCALKRQNEFSLEVSQADRSYIAVMTHKGATVGDVTAKIQISTPKLTLDTVLAGEAFLAGSGIPDAFQDLHRLAVRHASRNMPWIRIGTSTLGKQCLDAAETAMPQDEVSLAETAVGRLFESFSGNVKTAFDEIFEAHKVAPPTDTIYDVRITRHNDPDLKFRGRLLGRVLSNPRDGRAWAYAVYETVGGNLVASKEGLTAHAGETNRNEALVTKDTQEILNFFGGSALARTLYMKIGMEYATTVD